MSLKNKILLLVCVFGIQSSLQLISGIIGVLDGVSYGEYGNAFIQAGIMGYLAYAIYSTRTKWVYWFSMFFVGLAMIRFIAGTGLIVYSGIAPSAWQTALMVFVIIVFGIIPLLLLLNKEIRAIFLSSKTT